MTELYAEQCISLSPQIQRYMQLQIIHTVYARSWKEWMSPFERLRKVPKDLDV
jgi:hypothetical protein